MLSLRAKVDLAVMAMKEYSAFPKAPELLETHHQIVGKGLTPQQRCILFILLPQLTGQYVDCVYDRSKISIAY